MSSAPHATRIDRHCALPVRRILSACSLAALVVSTALVATSAQAASGSNLSQANAMYQRDRAACVSNKALSSPARAECVREAGIAREEAKRGRLNDGQAQFEANTLSRCNALPPADREACQRRMKGEGIAQGAVSDGGIYRELAIPDVAPQAVPVPNGNASSMSSDEPAPDDTKK